MNCVTLARSTAEPSAGCNTASKGYDLRYDLRMHFGAKEKARNRIGFTGWGLETVRYRRVDGKDTRTTVHRHQPLTDTGRTRLTATLLSTLSRSTPRPGLYASISPSLCVRARCWNVGESWLLCVYLRFSLVLFLVRAGHEGGLSSPMSPPLGATNAATALSRGAPRETYL